MELVMPYLNTWKKDGLHRTFTGMLTAEEVLTSNLSIHSDTRFEELKYVYNDFSKINDYALNTFDISNITSIDNIAATYNENLKIIIVATNKGVLKGAHIYADQLKDTTFNILVFENTESALKSIC